MAWRGPVRWLGDFCSHLLVREGIDSDDVTDDVGMALEEVIEKFLLATPGCRNQEPYCREH